MRPTLRATTPRIAFFLAVIASSACGSPQSAGTAAAPSPSSDETATTTAATSPSSTPTSSGAAASDAPPTKAECDAFMDVVARTTIVRAAIQREPSTAAKAADWAARISELAEDAKRLAVSHPDLTIERINLIGRLTDLASDLRALEIAEKGRDPAKKAAAHKHVLETSEQVEVLTREPAARCAGDTKLLLPSPGRLAASKVMEVVRAHFDDFKKCYEDGLKRDAKLSGRVAVRFVIGASGAVDASAAVPPNDPIPPDAIAPPSTSALPALNDAKTLECAASTMKKLTFPKPDGGAVTVVYPFTFSTTP